MSFFGVSVIFSVLDFVHVIRKVLSMALSCDSPQSLPSSSFSPSSSSSSSPLHFRSLLVPKHMKLSSENQHIENSCHAAQKVDILSSESHVRVSTGQNSSEEYPKGRLFYTKHTQDCSSKENLNSGRHDVILSGKCLESKGQTEGKSSYDRYPQENSGILTTEGSYLFTAAKSTGGANVSNKVRKRPARIIIPKPCTVSNLGEVGDDLGKNEFDVEGRDFYLASKKGRREVMEDDYGAITDIFGDHKQALFAVFDGHGGRAAVDYVVENLGNNIVKAIGDVGNADDQLEEAIRGGYLTTDKEFLSQGLSSGVCAATVFLKGGELHVANVGDCRVVLSRKGVADALTIDHRLNLEEERFRIERSGGYVYCRNGVWRVQGSLAVSRAIGDLHLKEWIISEPDTKKLCLTSDCEFLILATDGFWDKVTDQEAVDVVLQNKNSVESCKILVDMSSSRGSRDDITVMLVNLENFSARNS